MNFKNMLKSSHCAAFLLLLVLNAFNSYSQDNNLKDLGSSIHGNFQVDAQYYNPDSLIGAPNVPEKLLSNAFANLMFNKGKFSAGARYEAYNNVMQGFDSRYVGQGVVNRFVRYQDQLLDVTVGHIYEQFGSGLVFRTYYEPGLLYDNALDGIRVISNPYRGITLKGLIGKQRSFFTLGPGIVRGVDGEININELLDTLVKSKTKFIIGGSFASKYQADRNPNWVLPQNVGCYGGRFNIINDVINIFGEYVIKENDPSADNVSLSGSQPLYSYKNGEAMFLSASFTPIEGFSVLLQGKRIDNMGFRSDRDATLQNLLINYLPATTRQHTYLMPAFNPYATQPRGEVGGMAEIQYRFKKGTPLGGKYGTEITLNASVAHGLNQINVNDTLTASTLYKTKYEEVGELFYEDIFIEINKKISKKWKTSFMFARQFYNRNIVQWGSPFAGYPNIKASIFVADITYKYKASGAIRLETQWYLTDNYKNPNAGSWLTGMVEWNPNGHWFLAILNQYNYSNPQRPGAYDEAATKEANDGNKYFFSSSMPDLRLHYPLGIFGYTTGAHRITLNVGKQRAGIFCVGGVCRNVPASNGVAISITSSF